MSIYKPLLVYVSSYNAISGLKVDHSVVLLGSFSSLKEIFASYYRNADLYICYTHPYILLFDCLDNWIKVSKQIAGSDVVNGCSFPHA